MFHVELAPLGGIFGPLKSDLGVFWPFRGTDFILGKNKNANFSKSPHGPIFKFCVVIREAILQKMAPILAPVNFFLVLTLIGNCACVKRAVVIKAVKTEQASVDYSHSQFTLNTTLKYSKYYFYDHY